MLSIFMYVLYAFLLNLWNEYFTSGSNSVITTSLRYFHIILSECDRLYSKMMKTLYCSLSRSCTYKTTSLLIYKNVIHRNVNIFTYTTRNKRPLLIGKREKLRCEPHSVFSTRSLLLKDPEVLIYCF